MSEAVSVVDELDNPFARDRFLLKQKRLSINEKYFISDDRGDRILFVERPSHLLQQLLAVGACLAAITIVVVVGAVLSELVKSVSEDLAVAVGVGGLLIGIIGGLILAMLLYPKRHVTFYRDDTRREPLLKIDQDTRVQMIFADYTIRDPSGFTLARLRKNQFTNLIRRRWRCFSPSGEPMCVALEDSWVLAIARRLLGPLFGALRTNFIIVAHDGYPEHLLGKFDRKFTLFDQYVLDMTSDPERELDRRVAVAIGVLLDTGERR